MSDDKGKPNVVTDEELLALFLTLDGPIFSSGELAEHVRITRSGVHKRLDEMEDRSLVDSKRVGGGRAWWITDDGRSFLRDRDSLPSEESA